MTAASQWSRLGLPVRNHSIPSVMAFFVLAFALSWSVGFAAAHVHAQHPALSSALMMLAGFGPSVAGIAVVAALSTRQGLRDWLERCLNWRVGWRGFAFAFALSPAVVGRTLP